VSAVPDKPSSKSGSWGPPLRFALTVVIFGLLGFVIGAVITIVGYLALSMHLAFDNFTLAVAGLTAYGLLLAYPLLMMPVVGTLVAIRDLLGGTRPLEAAAIGGAVALLWLLLADSGAQSLFAYLLVISSIVASLVSWKATRWLVRLG
jgi:hypothetical protein